MSHESSSSPIVRLVEHLATAPNLLHYTITSPTNMVVDDTEYDGKWVFNAVFVSEDQINIESVSIGHEDFVTGLMVFTDELDRYLEGRNANGR